VGRELRELAQRIEPAATWDQLVLPPAELATLRSILAQVHTRPTVYQDWGFGERMSRGLGVSALFAGPAGTGKTMAAEIMADELRLDLYRIDLSGVVSKYIGETEKNLRRVFDAADQGGVILFFDEADALFGKRTEVKDSHDRHSNVEINYLLQRMEDYRGLSILATNRKADLDAAFLRRIRFLVSFPFPRAESRRRIWAEIFPPRVPLDDLDYAALSRLEIAGGNIRNVALNAAFAAAAEGTAVSMPHLMAAAALEYHKVDKTPSAGEFGDYYGLVRP
jgi:SpoVK/Ycf46/Vps4 family AAA+-type ATPase